MLEIRIPQLLTAAAFSTALSLVALSSPSQADNRSELRQGLPGRRISGGVRMEPASCFTNINQSLVALIPRNLLGRTASERPAFWFSIPETSGAKSISFELFDAADELLYSTQVDASDSHAIREFQLPESAPALAINENYRWVFSVACQDNPNSLTLATQGWVRRVAVSDNLAAQMATASPAERALLYEEAGLWQEHIGELANRRRRHPDSIGAQLAWAAVIQSTGLTADIAASISDTMTEIGTPIEAYRFHSAQ